MNTFPGHVDQEFHKVAQRLEALEDAVFKRPPGPSDVGPRLAQIEAELAKLQNESSTDSLRLDQTTVYFDEKIDRILRVVAELKKIIAEQNAPRIFAAGA